MLTKRTSGGEEINSNVVDEVDVWLIEINSSPALAEKLLPVFASKLVTYAIDSVYRDDNDEEEIEKESNHENEELKSNIASTTDSQLFREDFITIRM